MKEKPKIISGNVMFDKSQDYSNVEEITGYLDCRETDKDSFPKLKNKNIGPKYAGVLRSGKQSKR